MATRQWDKFDIEAAAEGQANRVLREMRPQITKPKKVRGLLNRQTVANARIIDNILLA
ncbi:hypothetical protein LCGC14_0580090 [marine sediment metagenome]|uniref:Uncharacterized protein n=1 Tax=marine sediment metagenome TaxID=412755 RepID=A0A0F9S0E0_9ZZZZ